MGHLVGVLVGVLAFYIGLKYAAMAGAGFLKTLVEAGIESITFHKPDTESKGVPMPPRENNDPVWPKPGTTVKDEEVNPFEPVKSPGRQMLDNAPEAVVKPLGCFVPNVTEPDVTPEKPTYDRKEFGKMPEYLQVGLYRTISAIREERFKQYKKWGWQNCTPAEWICIIGEEFGEASRQVERFHFDGIDPERYEALKKELIHLSAVTAQAIEVLDKQNEAVLK